LTRLVRPPIEVMPPRPTITLMLMCLAKITLITLIIRVIGAPWLLRRDVQARSEFVSLVNSRAG
jgi:hypothetical protein